jgi:tRNA pseudouridine38-40 synthase
VTALARRRCRIDISGDGFLYNMMRIIAGTLVEVGRGKLEPDDVPKILAAVDRTAAGTTLPPEGLFLMWVRY